MRPLLAIPLALWAGTASAETIDFEELFVPGSTSVEYISDVFPDAFTYTSLSGDYEIESLGTTHGLARGGEFSSWYTQHGTVTLWNDEVGDTTELRRADGTAFALSSIGFAELVPGTPSTIPLTGTRSDGAIVSFTVVTDGLPGVQSFTLPSDFNSVVSVTWPQNAPFNQFDDIVVDPPTSGPTLTFTGACPGMITIDITGLTAGSSFAAVRSSSLGTSSVPGGGCAGTNLGLASPRLVGIFPTGSGSRAFMPSIGPGGCGDFVQVVDLATCATTNVARF